MASGTKGKRPLRHLTASDKIDAIQRIHDGESKASVARDIGVPESTLRGWCKNEDKLRYMSRQSTPDKLMSDKFVEDAAAVACGLLNGPPEKRAKMDSGLSLSFGSNGKLKYDDLSAYKSRTSMNGLDLSGNDKGMLGGGDMGLNALSSSDFSAFAKTAADLSSLHASNKNSKDLNLKGYGADLTKPTDPTKLDLSMAAISPLTSLSHLSGMSSLGQSPLALSFNEIATNLNLFAQLNNSNLAAMSGFSGLTASSQSLRNSRSKANNNAHNQSPLSGLDTDKQQPTGLTVKNLAKLQQKTSNDISAVNLTDKTKKTTASTINRDAPVDDALWYWLKSQQAMLGINNLYSAMPSASSPLGIPSPQQQQQQLQHHQHQLQQLQAQTPQLPQPSQTPTPPIVASPQTTPPSSTPSGNSEDTKNSSSWFWQWYKTFGATLMNEKQLQMNNNNNNNNNTNNNNNNNTNNRNNYENILYSQLTKGNNCIDLINNNNNNNNNNINNNNNNINKPEDLSQHRNDINNHHETNNNCNTNNNNSENIDDNIRKTPDLLIKNDNNNDIDHDNDKTIIKARNALDNLLFNNNNNNNNNNINNNNINTTNNNNNNNDIKNDDLNLNDIQSPLEALEHGEKFLKWLESCSDPSVTAMQVMQFKYLLNSIKISAERFNKPIIIGDERNKIRRRK